MLGARGEFDVLAKQVQHPAELARGVVAGRAGMAVEIGADPTLGLHGADQLGLENRLLSPRRRRCVVNTASNSGPWLTITS